MDTPPGRPSNAWRYRAYPPFGRGKGGQVVDYEGVGQRTRRQQVQARGVVLQLVQAGQVPAGGCGPTDIYVILLRYRV